VLKQHATALRRLLFITDGVLSTLIFTIAVTAGGVGAAATTVFRGPDIGALLGLGVLAALSWPLILRSLGVYDSTRRKNPGALLSQLMVAGPVSAVVLSAAVFILGAPIPVQVPLLCAVGQLLISGLLRLAMFTGLSALRRRGRNTRNLLIIGSGPRAWSVHQKIERHPEWGLRVIAYVDEGDVPLDPSIPQGRLHKFIDTPTLLRDHVIDEAIIACPRSVLSSIGPVVASCGEAGVPVTMPMDLFGDYFPPPRPGRFGSTTTLSFAPVHHNRAMLVMKRGMDIIGAGIGLSLAAPILAAAAVAIKLTSPGSVLFRQSRCGLNGRPFDMLKLRTMFCDAEERRGDLLHLNEMDGPVFKIRGDPRITPVGRFLRRYSVDELPQLWNVFTGHMSLVGPRPPIPAEVGQYETSERRRLSMRPGLTCLWQVNGRNHLDFEHWVKLDLEYIDGWSLASDFKILAKTVPAVLRGTGA
jgi:exopolysaccharide biosynthesis polyprenyl glycosylphosphotransferase